MVLSGLGVRFLQLACAPDVSLFKSKRYWSSTAILGLQGLRLSLLLYFLRIDLPRMYAIPTRNPSMGMTQSFWKWGDSSTCFKGSASSASGTLLQELMEGTTPSAPEEWQTFSSFHKNQVCRRRCHCEKLWVFLTVQITFETRTFEMYCNALASSLHQDLWLGSEFWGQRCRKRCNECLTQRYSCFFWIVLVAACQCRVGSERECWICW